MQGGDHEVALKLAAASVAVVALGGIGLKAMGEDVHKGDAVVHESSKTGKWVDGPAPGVKMLHLRGDMEKGEHATFTKFVPGADHGWHTHTSDVTLVVLQGAYVFNDESGKETRVEAGDYMFIKGGTKHWSGGDAKEGCTFFQESPGKFDLLKAEAPKK